MGSIRKSHTMVATQVLISLCVAGLTSAVSQPVNQQVIVTDVVTALQPSIARAVANALSGLGGGSRYYQSSSSNGFSSGSRFAGVSGYGSSTGFASGSQFGGASLSGSGSSTGFASGSRLSGGGIDAAEPTARPEYAYQYQVSDDVDQTYISHNEARDGDEVNGAYSYVDANGDLITVNYQAGIGGYSQTLEKQVGAVEIRAKPVTVLSVQQVASSGSGAAGARFATSSGSTYGSSSGSKYGSSSGSSFRGNAASSSGSRFNSGSSSASLDQSALIAQILSALQPQISVAVSS